MEKLYNLYSVISNKTIRRNEKLYKRFRGHKFVPGTLVLTNRGYFIDGRNVDRKSVDLYFGFVESAKKGAITAPLYVSEV